MKEPTLVSEYNYDRVPTKEKFPNEPEEPPAAYGRGVRHTQVAIMFMTVCILFIARGHLGVTIVAMSDAPEDMEDHTDNYIGQLNDTVITAHDANATRGLGVDVLANMTMATNLPEDSTWNVYRTYKWKKSVQEFVLGGFFLGYCIMMFPIGLVCQRFGGKIPLQIALILNGFLSIAAPWLAVWGGWKAVTACRILQGMSQAGCFPSMHTLLAQWAPLTERARMTSYAFSGTTFGTVIAFQVAGFLSASSWGWPSMFWITGVLCLITFVLLTVFGAASPLDHKTMSEEEKNFILGRIGDGKKKVHRTPWKVVLTSKRTWAAFISQVGSGVTFVFFFTQVPSYLYYILHVNLKDSGVLSSLPYLISMFVGVGVGVLSDFLTNRKILSIIWARRLFNTIGQVGPAICFAAVSYTQDTTTAVIILILLLSTHVNMFTGWMINYIDLAPNFSGALMAAGNTFGNIVTVAMPPLASVIVTDVGNQAQWRMMFFIMAGLCIFTNAVFCAFVSVDTQWWNDIEDTKEDVEKPEKEKISNK